MKAMFLGIAAVLLVSPALADPCTARVTGYQPGQAVAGTVRYVGDGDGLCVGPRRDPATWTEIRLADFYAPELSEPRGQEAKRRLEGLVMSEGLHCG